MIVICVRDESQKRRTNDYRFDDRRAKSDEHVSVTAREVLTIVALAIRSGGFTMQKNVENEEQDRHITSYERYLGDYQRRDRW